MSVLDLLPLSKVLTLTMQWAWTLQLLDIALRNNLQFYLDDVVDHLRRLHIIPVY